MQEAIYTLIRQYRNHELTWLPIKSSMEILFLVLIFVLLIREV